MERLLELKVRTYISRDYVDYFDKQDTELPEGDEWKKDLLETNTKVPKTYPARILINPNKFLTAIETYSLEELHNNPDNPTFDTVDLCLEDGIQVQILGNLNEFQKKYNAFYE